MQALALEHLHSNPLGVYGEVLEDRGINVDRVLLDRGDVLPDWRAYDLLVVMGGGMSAYDDAAYPWLTAEKRTIREAVTAGVPYFGVCLGSQLLAGALGARVYLGPEPELGVIPVFLCEAARRDPVFRGLPPDSRSSNGIATRSRCRTARLASLARRATRTRRFDMEKSRMRSSATSKRPSRMFTTGSRRGRRWARRSSSVTGRGPSTRSWTSTPHLFPGCAPQLASCFGAGSRAPWPTAPEGRAGELRRTASRTVFSVGRSNSHAYAR